MKSYPIFVTLLVGILTGCSSISKFENRPRLGDAIVRCENPRAGGLAAGDAFVYIEGIDGANPQASRGLINRACGEDD